MIDRHKKTYYNFPEDDINSEEFDEFNCGDFDGFNCCCCSISWVIQSKICQKGK